MAQKPPNKFYSPLRYPGGKTKLAPFIKALFKENPSIMGCHYIEPYAGGAGVALSLLLEGYASKITINDFDLSIYAFWHSIVNDSEAFCEKIKKIPITVATWKKQKKIQNTESQKTKADADLFALGFSTFYLNRTNVSGVIKGGLIGGYHQSGEYKIDARFNKPALIEKIRAIAEHKKKITVTNDDAFDIIGTAPKDSFVYFDPPYVEKANGLYMNFYTTKDHENIAEKIIENAVGFHWLLSYDSNDLIKELYKSYEDRRLSWGLNYGSSNRKGTEDIFLHEDLRYKKAKHLLKTPDLQSEGYPQNMVAI